MQAGSTVAAVDVHLIGHDGVVVVLLAGWKDANGHVLGDSWDAIHRGPGQEICLVG